MTSVAQKIKLPYTPRFPQTEIHPNLESHRFNVLVTHRQLGKSTMAVNHCIKMAWKNRKKMGSKYFYVAPYRNQVKRIAWEYFIHYTKPLHHLLKFNEAELSITFPNKAKITLIGADNPDSLRGTYADGVVLDEYGDIKKNVFEEIIRPMLNDRKGWVLFFGTPKGQNQFFDIYRHAVARHAENPDGEWWAGMYKADETGVIDPKELEAIREETSDNKFRQEYLCDFTASAEDVVFTTEVLDKCKQELFYNGGERVAALDVARYGADSSVLCVMESCGPLKWREVTFDTWNGKDTMYTVGRVADAAKQYGFNRLIVDGDGIGGGVIDRLKELKNFSVKEFRGGATADDERFLNKRAESYFCLRDFMDSGKVSLSNKAVLTELATLTHTYNSKGQIKMFDKEEYKKEFGKSPDWADSIMMCSQLMKTSTNKILRRNSRDITASAEIYF